MLILGLLFVFVLLSKEKKKHTRKQKTFQLNCQTKLYQYNFCSQLMPAICKFAILMLGIAGREQNILCSKELLKSSGSAEFN